ncbi:MAG: glycerate kinase [Verrucomicrobiaceae bacterium]|nr:glycerate kinase [Verrucomicrobiaceae bacterium]
MKILVASDKFKGSLTAAEACAAIAAGLLEGSPDAAHEIRCLPIADGGDGIADTLTRAKNGTWIRREVHGPLGKKVTAAYGLLDGGKTAVIEMAAASGLALPGETRRDPLRASTYGTGELLRDAIARGVGEVLLGIGGSATNDGGSGMALALGYRFYDSAGNALTGPPADLDRLARIEPPDTSSFPEVIVACDVSNPLLGPRGCTAIYGPQKGITPETFSLHENRLARLVAATGERGKAAADTPGAGAAGGLGFGAMVFLGATLVPGFDLVATRIGLADAVSWADLVVTGEGRLDHQSLEGKGPGGVVALARAAGKSTAAFCGSLENRALEANFGPVVEIGVPQLPLTANLARGGEHLRAAARAFAPTLSPPDRHA